MTGRNRAIKQKGMEDVWEDLGYKPLDRNIVFDPDEQLDPAADDYLAHYPKRMTREEGMAEWRRQLRRAS